MKAKEVIERLEKAQIYLSFDGMLLYALNKAFGDIKYNTDEMYEWVCIKSPTPTLSQKRACIENSIAHYKQLDPESEV